MFSWFRSPTPNRDARGRVAGGALLLDVRTAGEFAEGHVEGALNIPLQELAARLLEIEKGREVVVYCRSGGRSAVAAQMLRGRGHAVLDVGAMSAY